VSSAIIQPSLGVCLFVGAVQVPDVLFAVCSSAVQHSGVQEVTAPAITAFAALYDFFHKGTLQGGFLLQTDVRTGLDPNIAHSATTTTGSSSALSLVPGMRSQVLQSGLMGAFAAAMAAATDEVLRHPPYCQQAVGTSTAAAGAGHLDHGLFPTQGQYFTRLLWSWHWVCQLWPAGREQVAAIAIAAPAAVQLSAAILQVVSRDLPAAVAAEAAAATTATQVRNSELDQAIPPGAVDSATHGMNIHGISYADGLSLTVSAVRKTLTWLAYFVGVVFDRRDLEMPELRPLLAMPEFTTVLATMAVLMSEALLAQQWLGPPAAATSTHNTSSRSSRSSSNGTGGGSSAVGSSRPLPTSSLISTKVTRKLEAALQSLPECTKTLLGMDSRAMVWAAAAQREQASSSFLTAITIALERVFEHHQMRIKGNSSCHFWSLQRCCTGLATHASRMYSRHRNVQPLRLDPVETLSTACAQASPSSRLSSIMQTSGRGQPPALSQ